MTVHSKTNRTYLNTVTEKSNGFILAINFDADKGIRDFNRFDNDSRENPAFPKARITVET
jgi:hypothetical protein